MDALVFSLAESMSKEVYAKAVSPLISGDMYTTERQLVLKFRLTKT